MKENYSLEQNHESLQGKLERIVDRGDYQLGFPWWILSTDYDSYLVVYHVLKRDSPSNEPESEGEKQSNINILKYMFKSESKIHTII